MSLFEQTVGSLRQPEYVGENRCWPCTITNVAIAVVLAAVVAAAAALGASGGTATLGYAASGGLFLASLGAIWLRGYLVPGTPELTKRYFPDWVLAKFDKLPAEADRVDAAEIDVEQALLAAGILEPCEQVDDLCVNDAFGDAWRARIETIRQEEIGPELLRDFFPVDVEDIAFQEQHDDAVITRMNGTRIAHWESDAALIADAAAADVLLDRYEEWDTFAFDAQVELVGGLRLFLEKCPSCDGAISFGEETVESCCRSVDVVALTCEDCGRRLFEAEVTQEMYDEQEPATAG
jgi:hypothetical protein